MKKMLIIFTFTVLAYAGFTTDGLAQAGTSWQRVYPNIHSFNGMVTGGGLTIAVGNQGELTTSPDGINWVARNSGADLPLYSAAWTLGKYIVVGANATILFSKDGKAWVNISKAIAPTLRSVSLNGVVWGNAEFVAVGSSGTVVSSADGLNWTTQVGAGISDTFQDITWNGTIYVAVGGTSTFTSLLYTSLDGITWTKQNTGIASRLYDVAWNGTNFVAVGENGGIFSSPDGISWVAQTSGTTQQLMTITWTGTQFIAAGWVGTILTSTNGTVWSTQTSPTREDIQAVNSNATLIMAGTRSGSLMSSTNGVTWTGPASSFYFESCNDITWDQASTYVAICGNGLFLSSTDTYTWAKTKPPLFGYLDAIVWDGSQFVVSGGTFIYTSTNGTTWAQQTPGAPFSGVRDMVWNGAQFVAVGSFGKILTSPDAVTWTQQTSGVTASLDQVVWQGGKFIAFNYTGVILTSIDGVTWATSASSGTYRGLSSMIWDGARYVAISASSTVPENSIMTSLDGNAWTFQSSNLPAVAGRNLLHKILHNGTQYIAVGSFGRVFTSIDGLNWKAQYSGSSEDLLGLMWNGVKYIASGSAETLLTSSDEGALPVITINGQNPIITGAGVAYIDVGATASDVEDGNLTSTMLTIGAVDTNKLGSYNIIYSASDSQSHVTTAMRVVNVEDITPPTVTAPNNITVEATGPTTSVTLDPYSTASATDNIDGQLTPYPNQSTFAVGVHGVTWAATDQAGNTGTASQTVNVTDTTPPIITVGGNITLPQGSPPLYIWAGVRATDLVDGNLSNNIVQTGYIDLNVPSTYTITFTATDASGNTGSANRTITVVSNGSTPPGSAPAGEPPASGGGGCMIQSKSTLNLLLVGMLLLTGMILARKRK